MPRSILALAGGLLTFLVVVRGGSWLAAAASVGPFPEASPAQLGVTLVLGAVAGIAAGYIAAMAGRTAPMAHALGAAVILVALSFYVLPRPTDSRQPQWFPYALTALTSVAILAGGALRVGARARSNGR